MSRFGIKLFVLPKKFPSPAYSATTVCKPRVKLFVVNVAAPPVNVPEPTMLPSTRKFTVPVGVPAPGDTTLNAAVKVTFDPDENGFGEVVVNASVVDACVMVKGVALDDAGLRLSIVSIASEAVAV